LEKRKLVKLVNFECPEQFLNEFDEAIKDRFKTRAEAIRTAMRDLLLLNEAKKRGEA